MQVWKTRMELLILRMRALHCLGEFFHVVRVFFTGQFNYLASNYLFYFAFFIT